MKLIIYVICISIFYLFFKKSEKEKFEPYNVFEVDKTEDSFLPKLPDNNVLTIEQENENIIQQIESHTTLNVLNTDTWDIFPYFQTFPLTDTFKIFILKFLDSLNLHTRLNSKIDFVITLNFSNIKSTIVCDSEYYVFQCELINQTLNVPQSFLICLRNKNNALSLIYMKRVASQNIFNVKSNNEDLLKTFDSEMFLYFRTKNTLFLLEPFKTSANDT
jgi:hypothetical protein